MGLIFAHKEGTRQGVQKTMMQLANYCNGERGRDGGGSNKKHKGSLSFRGDASLCQSLPPKKSSTWVKLGEVGSCVTLSFVDTGDVTLPPIELLKY
jgi:hypothetical protein